MCSITDHFLRCQSPNLMTLSYYDWKIPHFLCVAIYNSLASWIIAVLSNVELVGGCYEQYKTLGPLRVYLRSGIGTNTVRDSWKCKIHISPWGTGFDCYPGSEIHQKLGMGSGFFFSCVPGIREIITTQTCVLDWQMWIKHAIASMFFFF